jgi:hypothetical protein
MSNKKRSLGLTLLVVLISQFTFAQKTIQLFNQEDLEGWYAFEPETGKFADAAELFSVEQNMIRLYGKKKGYLMFDQPFHEFKLTVEFKWNTDSTFVKRKDDKNSGIIYLIPTDAPDTTWPTGFQFQLTVESTGDFVLSRGATLIFNGERTMPRKTVILPRSAVAVTSISDWNTAVITFKNNQITHELNGILVNEGTDPSVTEGRILLQYEGYPIDFRKVEIEEL